MEEFKTLFHLVRPFWKRVAAAALISLIISGLNASIAWLVKPALDNILIKKDMTLLVLLPIGVMIIFSLKGLLTFFHEYLMRSASQKMVMGLRGSLYKHILRLPISYFSKHSSGTLMSKVVNDTNKLQAVVSLTVKDLFIETTTNLMRGFAINADKHYFGGLLPLLNLYSLLGGLVFVGLFTLHGAGYLSIKLTGDINQKAKDLGGKIWIPTVVLAVGFLVWTYLGTDILNNSGFDGFIPALAAALSLLAYGWFIRKGKEGLTFISGGLVILFATIMVFTGLFPRILISTLNPDFSLTIYNSAASPYTLKLFTIVGLILLPVVILYQSWTYWIFRQRISPESKESDLHY